MHKILVPIDFSDTSLNAARFVAGMVTGQSDTHIILYNNYQHEDDFSINKSYLESLQKEIQDKGNANVEIELERGGDFVDNLDRLAHTRRSTLIAMGITGQSGIKQQFIGSNTLKTVDRSIYPVMIIPPDAKFSKFSNIAFACDFNDVEISTPTVLINSVLELFNPKLHVVNINPDYYISITDDCKAEMEKLKKMFAKYEIEFHFITMNNFQEGIHSFLSEVSIDMLITIPRHHSSTTGLWAKSNTRKLAYHNHIPILTVHQ
jgi:nucleotide-binding universal stress UspA family protein